MYFMAPNCEAEIFTIQFENIKKNPDLTIQTDIGRWKLTRNEWKIRNSYNRCFL